MKFPWSKAQSPNILSCTLFYLLVSTIAASDVCQPSTWSKANVRRAEKTPSIARGFKTQVSLVSTGYVQPGQVNCRYSATTSNDVNYYTCTQLSNKYGITVDVFFILNPGVNLDCGNIQPSTSYCVAGFIEPLRATNGLCGPPNNNATCLGTDYQCCNAVTWTCGDSTDDCAPGTCYEGACAGDSIYSTDGTCGYQHSNRYCAGKWGTCCNKSGQCGNGTNFCSTENCQSGNCTWPVVTNPGLPWLSGNTTDGTCGGVNSYTCDVTWGNCCNKNGECGSLPSDCGAGCQPQYGTCSTPLSSSTTNSSSTKYSSSTIMTGTSKTTSSSSTFKPTTSSTTKTTSTTASTTGLTSLPSCGQLCFNNMLAQYSSLGCATPDPSCLCSNVNFGYGIRDCSNGACGTAVASTVIAYGSTYCSSALATAAKTTSETSTITGIASLPSCGQLCFNNMLGQYSTLGCASPDPTCLCKNVDFGNGIRDCSNGACGTAVASTVISFGSSYCASATAAPKAR